MVSYATMKIMEEEEEKERMRKDPYYISPGHVLRRSPIDAATHAFVVTNQIDNNRVRENLGRVIGEEKPELLEEFSIEWLDEQFRKWAVNEKKEDGKTDPRPLH